MSCCGFTGYRFEKLPFSRRDYGAIEGLKERLRLACVKVIDAGYTHFISGFAQGSDLLFAETVLELGAEYEGIELEAALPFPEPCAGWPLSDQRQFHALLERCSPVTSLSPAYAAGCYYKRNDYILENSDRLIAVFNPADHRRGGTAYTVNRAIKMDMTIDFIIP